MRWICVALVVPWCVWAGEPANSEPAADVGLVQLADVEVSTRRIAEPLAEAPVSVTVLTRDDLEAAGITTVAEAVELIPNVFLIEQGVRRTFLPFARGVGAGQGTPAITTYIDGVPQPYQDTGNIHLHDVEQIEFARGPQSTLYGRNALGGVLNIVTRRARTEWGGQASMEVGSDNLLESKISTGGPLDDEVFVNLSLGHDERAGLLHNRTTGTDLSARDAWHGRLGLTWIPDADWQVDLSIVGESDRDGGYTYVPLALLESTPHTAMIDEDGFANRDFTQVSLGIHGEIDGLSLRTVNAYGYSRVEEQMDVDLSPADLVVGYVDDTIHNTFHSIEVGSQEDEPLTLGADLTLSWLVGGSVGYTQSLKYDQNDVKSIPARFVTEAEIQTWSFGLYGQVALRLHDRLGLTLALRDDYERSTADIYTHVTPALSPDRQEARQGAWNSLSPQLTLSYDVSDGLMVYGSVSRGYRPGGFNLVTPLGEEVYDAESMWSYEIGAKAQAFDDRLAVNVSVFHTDWEDQQAQIFDPNSSRLFVKNVGKSTSNGFEVELRARPLAHTELMANIGYTQMRYVDYMSPFNGDVSGNDAPYVPEYTWMAAIQQEIPLRRDLMLYARGELTGMGRRYSDPVESESQEPFMITNLTCGIRWRRAFLELAVHNVTDEQYILQAVQYGPTTFIGTSGAPRTWGLIVGIKW